MARLAQGLHRHVHIVKVIGQQIIAQRLRHLDHIGDLPRQHRYQRTRPHLILPVLQDDGALPAGKQPEAGHLVDQRRGGRVNGLHGDLADLAVIRLRAV